MYQEGAILCVGLDGKVALKCVRGMAAGIVSARAAVQGSMDWTRDPRDFALLAYVGRVPVSVRGPVKPGDYIVPSGLHDGTGIAERYAIDKGWPRVGYVYDNAVSSPIEFSQKNCRPWGRFARQAEVILEPPKRV
eukprot:SAG31_NODE_18242_length_642_cov_1.173112_1_plen_134_part_01